MNRVPSKPPGRSEPFDLMEIHVVGGPWTYAEALKLGEAFCDCIAGSKYADNVYVADIRGSDSEEDAP